MEQTTTIFFWAGDGYAEAKRLAHEEKEARNRAFTRDAGALGRDIDLELCTHVVVLPSVRPDHANRIARAYKHQQVTVDIRSNGHVPPEDPTPRAPRGPLPEREKLRRLPTRNLRAKAREYGVDETRMEDRAELIEAILAQKDNT